MQWKFTTNMTDKHQKICVGGMLLRDNKVLVVRRSARETLFPGMYELPGGKVDFGEHPEQALIREFQEETRLDVRVGEPFRIFTYVTNDGKRHTVEIVFYTHADEEKEPILSDAHDDYKWITKEELDSVPLTATMKENIEEGFATLNHGV